MLWGVLTEEIAVWYKLDENHRPVPATMEEAEVLLSDIEKRVVKQDDLCDGEVSVSTVFLVLDHNHARGGKRLLFETMIFGKDYEGDYQTRCSTWEEALEMHEKALNHVFICETQMTSVGSKDLN